MHAKSLSVSSSLWPHGLYPTRLLSMGFARQDYWSVLPFPPPGNLPHPGIKPMSPVSPALIGRQSLYHWVTWETIQQSGWVHFFLSNVWPSSESLNLGNFFFCLLNVSLLSLPFQSVCECTPTQVCTCIIFFPLFKLSNSGGHVKRQITHVSGCCFLFFTLSSYVKGAFLNKLLL